MRAYETVVILRPDTTDSQVGIFIKKVEKILSAKPGEMTNKDDWGVRRLAYEVKGQKKGRYVVWSYHQTPDAIKSLERQLKFDEAVIRSMTVVVSDKPIEPAARAKLPKKAAEVEKGGDGEEGRDGSKRPMRRRGPHFFEDASTTVDYKDVTTLSGFVTERGKIVPMRMSGMNAFQQRALARAVKRARQIALLSFSEGHTGDWESAPRSESAPKHEGVREGSAS